MIALAETVADIAVAEARKRDQTRRAFGKPLAPEFRSAAMLVGSIRARQPLGELEIALARLTQQQQAMRRVTLGLVRDPDVAADDRLDTGLARRGVELDQAEHVGQVGERNGGHLVGDRGRDRVVDAHHAVNDGVFAVQAQMHEARQ